MQLPYENYFSRESILEVLCKYRISKAKVFHEKRFKRKIVHNLPKEDPPELYSYFPPRNEWHRFRPRKHKRNRSGDHTLQSLKKAIAWHSKNKSQSQWLTKLNAFISEVQSNALSHDPHEFAPPNIRPEHKKGNHYRAISSLSTLEDKVIDNLNAKYLREILDVTFEPSSVAFRAGSNKYLDRNYAIQKIIDFRRRHENKALYVTECDIRGFFDCVHHTTAKQAITQAIQILQYRSEIRKIDKRALAIFEAYLNCYSFSKNVKKGAEKSLKRKVANPAAIYKWPVAKDTDISGPYYLAHYHRSPLSAKIGIPQGGAHSCLIANLLLNLADKEVLLALSALDEDSLYLRFCDDIIILTETKSAAEQAFKTYTRCLEAVKLPFHKQVKLNGHGKAFFEDSKTKVAFEWSGGNENNQYPWIQFLGYQIRYDNYLRVRPSSIRKHKKKVDELFISLQKTIRTSPRKVSNKRVLYRFNSKIWAFSSGRINIHSPNPKPLPMCWCNGFIKLSENEHDRKQIRELDRHVGKYRRRMQRYLKKTRGGKKSKELNPKALSFYGAPFSHQRQFKNK